MDISVRKTSATLFDQDMMKEVVRGSALANLQLAKGAFRGILNRVELGPVCIDFGAYNLRVLARGELASDRYTFAMLLQSSDETKLYKKFLPRFNLIMFPCGYEMDVFLGNMAEWVCITVNKKYFSDFYEQLTGKSKDSLPERPLILKQHQYDFRALNQILKIILGKEKVLHQGKKYAVSPVEMLDELTFVLARSLLEYQEKDVVVINKNRRVKLVNQAEELFNSDTFLHQIDKTTMPAICKLFNVSIRTLEYAFRESYGLSPAKFLKLIRLNKVRNALLFPTTGPQKTVTEIAVRYGFTHLSQFAADYRSSFSELPSETLLKNQIV